MTPTLEETRRLVQASLKGHENDLDHEAILRGLQDEIDTHNAIKDDVRRSMRDSRHSPEKRKTQHSPISVKFRFKTGVESPHKLRDHRCRRNGDGDKKFRRKRKHERPAVLSEAAQQGEGYHPFPREQDDSAPIDSECVQDAFRASLFDALADDEGAAYWESVYSQPVHIYPRPAVETSQGELEQMDDDEYAAYVKAKMWERKHPEVVKEKEKSERKRRLEDEEKTRRREEFVRRKQRAAWERSQRWSGDEEDNRSRYAYGFSGSTGHDGSPSGWREREAKYTAAWSGYLAAWDQLKQDLLAERGKTAEGSTARPANRLPWPVLTQKPVVKSNIDDFMRHAPAEDASMRLSVLKSERVRWHPDKVQHIFAGKVDEGTMKIVTGIFQVVDALVDEERARASSAKLRHD